MKTLIFPVEFTTNCGGVAQSTISLATGFGERDDYRVVIICAKDSQMSKVTFPRNVIVRTTIESKWIISKQNIIGTFCTVLSLYRKIKPFISNNTWIVTNQPVTSALVAMMPCKHIPEIYINRGGDLKGHSPADLFIRYKLRHHKIECAIGISQRQVDVLVETGQPRDKIFLIHNGLSIPCRGYSYTNLKKDKLKISTMGFISDLKNQKEGVKLVKLLQDNGVNAVLNMYGEPDNDKQYQVEMAELIERLGLKDNVNYCGFVSGEDLFKDTDILISFSRTEGFGRSLVEGMLRKKPVIAWRGAGGPVDITNNGQYCHLVQNNEASEYFDTIMNILNNPAYNKQNVLDSYQYAISNFTIECMVEKYVELFEQICR